MRPTLWVSLVAVCAILGGMRVHATSTARSKPAAKQSAAAAKNLTWSKEDKAAGFTIPEAEVAAGEKATEAVLDYLKSRNPALEWKPSVAYVDRHLLRDKRPSGREPSELFGKEMETVTWRVEITPKDYDEILRLDRQVRVSQRHALLFKGLMAVVAALVAVAGYFRLEDATKGYYTWWLRLAAGGLVALAAAATLVLA